MSKFIIQGGKPLRGSVRLGGAKNASFKLMIASLLCDSETRLLNIPDIGDVHFTKKIMERLGADVTDCGERIFCIKTKKVNSWKIPGEHGKASRASVLFAPVLLSQFGKAELPLPGGDKLGNRPIDRHIEALKALGAIIKVDHQSISLTTSRLNGTHFKFPKNSHTGTEVMIMAAVKAKGRTVIENAAQEPEIDDLITYLNKCGARIKRTEPRIIEIDGVSSLEGSIHKIMPDRNEAVSYACAALGSKGDIIIENANPKHLTSFLGKVREAGGFYDCADYGIRFWYQNPLKSIQVTTAPHPSFMSDWQPLWTTLMTQASGESTITESVFPNRFSFTNQLKEMGANILLFNPDISNPNDYYNFNLDDDKPGYFHAARVIGPTQLTSIHSSVSDIRNGATLVLAALIASGKSEIDNIELIDRGYENFDVRLRRLGADIIREK